MEEDAVGTKAGERGAERSLIHTSLHINYFMMAANSLPHHYVGLDNSRMSAIYFIVVALDLLNALDDAMRVRFVDAIYFYQLHPQSDADIDRGVFGFIGGSFLKNEAVPGLSAEGNKKFIQGHIAMTYTALATLVTLGDDLSRVQVEPIRQSLRLLQASDGSFSTYLFEGESDVRFVYCACAIASILDLWDAIDVDAAVCFVRSCFTYEGAFGLQPGLEAHGGGTYCAVASLALMGRLSDLSPLDTAALITWCEQRQVHGFQGRVNKDADSCYAFWVGSCLQMLGAFGDSDQASTRAFILDTCQVSQRSGGFRKFAESYPDIMHSYYSLCWLSLAGELKAFDPRLAICADKAAALPHYQATTRRRFNSPEGGATDGGDRGSGVQSVDG